jgi:GTP-binding protein YchF
VALTIGIVGLPNVGKSTLFNALTGNNVLAENYPFATIDPNVGVVPLPDPRLAVLARLFDSAKQVPATVSFVDIAGIVRGASEGEGLGNQFLANIREADAICQVIRGFTDPDVVHVDGTVDPAADIETIDTELILADLQTLDRVIPRLEKETKIKRGDPAQLTAAIVGKEILDGGTTLFAAAQAGRVDLAPLREFSLMTAKPFLYVFNADDALLSDDARRAALANLVAPAEAIFMDAQLESELQELAPADAAELLAESGQTEPGLNHLARVGFATLGLQTFLTAGPKESRAWTIHRGWTAPQAAGVIHSDFERGFIKAEVVSYDDLIELGSVAAARAAGKLRIEGKDYIMAEGDVVEFRVNPTPQPRK